MPATIKDIARKLNVSISTVSYALNGGPRQVPNEVRERVLAAAQELDYRPNSLARSMATGRTDTIAVVPPRGQYPLLMSPYLQTVMNGIVEAATELGQDILLHTALGDADPASITRTVLGGRADGIFLIAPPAGSHLAREISDRNFPCVVFSSDGPDTAVTIGIDNRGATKQAMDFLCQLGHRHIGHISGRKSMRDAQEREAAYREYLPAHQLPACEEWIGAGEFETDAAIHAAIKILKSDRRPTAILAANDESAIGVIEAARSLRLRVPDDLSVIGFDALTQENLASHHLTSMRQPIQQMAMSAMTALVRWAREGVRPAPARIVFPSEIVVQATTAPPKMFHESN